MWILRIYTNQKNTDIRVPVTEFHLYEIVYYAKLSIITEPEEQVPKVGCMYISRNWPLWITREFSEMIETVYILTITITQVYTLVKTHQTVYLIGCILLHINYSSKFIK